MIPLGVLAARRPAGGGALALTWQQAAASTSNLASYTFSSQNIGPARADRLVVVAVATRKAPPSPTSVTLTIGGVAATIDATETANNNGNFFAIGHAAVPTGTTADIVATFSAQGLRCGIGVWTITGSSDITASGASSNGVNSASAAITVPPGGAAVAMAGAFNLLPAEPNNFSWATSTERHESVIETGFGISYADLDTSGTVSVTGPGGMTDGMTLVVASYGPA